MSKNKNGNGKKHNPPYYMNNNGFAEITPEEQKQESGNQKAEPVKKFQLGIDINNNPIVTIDNVIHFMNQNQFHAFTLGIINISKRVNPEINYSEIFIK